MNYPIQATLTNGAALILLASVLLNFCRKNALQTHSSKVFVVMVLLNLMQCILEPATLMLDGHMFAGAIPLNTALNVLLFVNNILFAYCWLLYAYLRVQTWERIHPALIIAISLPALFVFLGAVANVFTPVYFSISPQNVYQRTDLFLFAFAVTYFYLVLGSIVAYGFLRRMDRYIFLPALTFLMPVFLASMTQMLFPGISVLWAGTAIGLTSAYIARLDERASIDSLSGAFSRPYMNLQISTLSTRARGNKLWGGIMLDVDDFKQINDRFGHLTGDEVIAHVGQLLRKAIQRKGTLFRYGGDEFTILQPVNSGSELQATIDQIKAQADAFNAASTYPYKLGFSIGHTLYSPGESELDFIHRMDEAMYEDKKQKLLRFISPLNSLHLEDGLQLHPDKNYILIIDDDFINREILKNIFTAQHRFLEAEDGEAGLRLINEHAHEVCAILLDMNMPLLNGLELLRILNAQNIPQNIPTFLITANDEVEVARQAYALGVMDVISKPIVPFVILRRVQSVIELFQARDSLKNTVRGQEQQLLHNANTIGELHRGTIEALASAIEFRDAETGEHTSRIYTITKYMMLYTDMGNGFSTEEIENIAVASIMHDIGKIAVSDVILNKPGRLTPEEYELMKQHTVKGAALMSQLTKMQSHPSYQYACDIALHHHERWDGSGYPDGLKGEDITIWSQIVSLADVYDALMSPRVYRAAFTPEKAMEIILNGECGAFNPKLLDCFQRIEPELRKLYLHPQGIDPNENPVAAISQTLKFPLRSSSAESQPRKELMDVLLLMSAVKSAYDLIISVNLTQNTFSMIDYDRFLTHCAGHDGVFDDLIAAGASSIPESHRQLFIDTFSRKSLLEAFARGETSVRLVHPQYTDNHEIQNVFTNVLFTKDVRNGDVLEITLSRYLGKRPLDSLDLEL